MDKVGDADAELATTSATATAGASSPAVVEWTSIFQREEGRTSSVEADESIIKATTDIDRPMMTQ